MTLRSLGLAAALSLAAALHPNSAFAQQGGFTYQGRVTQNGAPFNGTATIGARIYGSANSPTILGSQTFSNVPVNQGVFTLELNTTGTLTALFGTAPRWLEITVNGEVQTPRTRILGVPYSIYAASSGAPWFPLNGNATIGGLVGVGVPNATTPSARLQIVDSNNLPTNLNLESFGSLKITNGSNQALIMDSNQIESVGDNLYLNFRNTDGTGKGVVIAGGGGNVSIGNAPLTEKLNVGGNIRLADDSSIFGVDQIVGFNDLRLYGDASGGPDLSISPQGRIGHRAMYNNVSFNVRGDPFQGETQHFRVEDFLGSSIFEIQSDRDVFVNGDFLVVNGSKNFIIDHPLDPSNSDLAHNAVEGPGYYTHYHGNATLGADGSAWVELPDYFDALNTDPSYQLTPIGASAPVYVAEEARNNRFQIAGGKPGMKVSWQVHASRNDPYAQDHPYRVTRPKDEPGKLLYNRSAPKPVAAK